MNPLLDIWHAADNNCRTFDHRKLLFKNVKNTTTLITVILIKDYGNTNYNYYVLWCKFKKIFFYSWQTFSDGRHLQPVYFLRTIFVTAITFLVKTETKWIQLVTLRISFFFNNFLKVFYNLQPNPRARLQPYYLDS